MKKIITTKFSTVEVVNNYLVVTMNDGSNLGDIELSYIQEIANEHIVGQMGYISNHIHDYSISPVDVVSFVINNPRVKYIAYVADEGDHRSRLMALLRLIPSAVKFRTFRNLGAAKEWIEENVKIENRNEGLVNS